VIARPYPERSRRLESRDLDRRNAPRYTIPAGVILHRESGAPIPATAVNISSSGMLVRLEQPVRLKLGESVTVEVELSGHDRKALSNWGIGSVVRVDGDGAAIQLRAGHF
jgi:c-di-GMP-binding flagellar brake protein YcgR